MKRYLWIIAGFAIAAVLTQYVGPGHTFAESMERTFWVSYGVIMCWWIID